MMRGGLLHGATAAVAVTLFVVVASAMLQFPFTAEPFFVRRWVAVAAVGSFVGGMLALMLGRKFWARVLGVHVMAASVAIVLLALAGDSGAWLIAVIGWGAVGVMSAWGRYLGRGNFLTAGGKESWR